MKTLILTLEEFQKYVPLASNFNFEDLAGDILLIEDELIRKYLGEEFHEELLDKYETGSLSELTQKLLDYLQQAVANLSTESHLIMGQLDINNMGIHIHSDDDTKTAFQWQINELRESLLRKGYKGLEKALAYLAKNADQEEFKTWKESGLLSLFREHFINSASEFSSEYPISDSWLTFAALLPSIRKTERMRIVPNLGDELAEQILTEIKTGAISPESTRLLRSFIRPALAHLAAAKALAEQTFRITPDGLEITYARVDDSNSKEADADNAKLLQLKIAEAQRDGDKYLAKMRDYLNRNASAEKYAAYYNSPLYTSPEAEKPTVNRSGAKSYRAF